jgi:hypothetical protein
MMETCRSIFQSFNVNNLSVCIGWCADQVTLRSARCNDKEAQYYHNVSEIRSLSLLMQTHEEGPTQRSSVHTLPAGSAARVQVR